MGVDARALLAQGQVELVRALRRRSQGPPELDAGRLKIARRQLEMKRWRVMAKAWPAMTRELGADPPTDELQILACQPLDPVHPGLADGLRLAGWLRTEGALGSHGHRELVSASLAYRICDDAVVFRRWPAVAWSRMPEGLLIGLRIPRLCHVVWHLPR